MSEEWRPVVGRESEYEVSNLGRVRSLTVVRTYRRNGVEVKRRHRGKLLRPGIASHGYPTVCFGRGNTVSVHVILLTAFVGPCPPGHESLHGDDVRTHCRLDNLSWGTRSQNIRDSYRRGRRKRVQPCRS